MIKFKLSGSQPKILKCFISFAQHDVQVAYSDYDFAQQRVVIHFPLNDIVSVRDELDSVISKMNKNGCFTFWFDVDGNFDDELFEIVLKKSITHYMQSEKKQTNSFYIDEMSRLSEKKLKRLKIYQSLEAAIQWQEMPPNLMTPEKFAALVKLSVSEANDNRIKLHVYRREDIIALNMNLFLAVNKGSDHEPYVLVVEYHNNNQNLKKTIGIAGKGITMDTGGYNLKSSPNQWNMKFDMSGAAIAFNILMCAAKLNLPVNLCVAVGLTENCIGGHATFTNSVVQAKGGKYVEISNTDAEGRLVLADLYSLLRQDYQVSRIISLATLTGNVQRALGAKISGVFTNDEKWFEEFKNLGLKNDEPLWMLPIQPENYTNLISPVADLRNTGINEKWGVGNAAAFLMTFMGDDSLMHFDIAGTADDGLYGTGVLLKTIVDWLEGIK